MEGGESSLLALPDDLLVGVLQQCGAKTAARASACCRRLRMAKAAQEQHAAFASAMVMVEDMKCVEADVAKACDTALSSMPDAPDFALLFLANFPSSKNDTIQQALECIACRLPPGSKVVGCTGRGIFGTLDSVPAEIDPSSRQAGISLLLGRVPGATAHAFAARKPEGGWASQASCREWMGLDSTAEPLSLMLFSRSGCTHLLEQCLTGLQAGFPDLVVTGGVASGLKRKGVFCFTVPPAQGEVGMEEPSSVVNEALDKQYAGLVLCRPSLQARDATATPAPLPSEVGSSGGPGQAAGKGAAGAGRQGVRAGALTAKGLVGAEPVFYDVGLVRGLGSFVNEEGEEIEMLMASAASAEGGSGMEQLASLVEMHGHADLALWAANRDGSNSYSGCVDSQEQVVMLDAMSHHTGVLMAVLPEARLALEAILLDSERPGRVLCGQLVVIAAEGYLRDISLRLPTMLAACAGSSGGKAPLAPPYHGMGLMVVSCTAKGSAVHGAVGVEAQALGKACKGPMAGVYCDGEIGPALPDGRQCGLRWAGGDSAGSHSTSKSSDLMGFTTVVTLLSG